MGLIWEIFKSLTNASNNEKQNELNKLSKECDMIGLDKEEKNEVMKGNQDPWDFEWDGTEESDYYKDTEK